MPILLEFLDLLQQVFKFQLIFILVVVKTTMYLCKETFMYFQMKQIQT